MTSLTLQTMVLLLDYGAVPIDHVKSEPSANQPGRQSRKIVAVLGCIAAFALIAMAYQFSAEVRKLYICRLDPPRHVLRVFAAVIIACIKNTIPII